MKKKSKLIHINNEVFNWHGFDFFFLFAFTFYIYGIAPFWPWNLLNLIKIGEINMMLLDNNSCSDSSSNDCTNVSIYHCQCFLLRHCGSDNKWQIVFVRRVPFKQNWLPIIQILCRSMTNLQTKTSGHFILYMEI